MSEARAFSFPRDVTRRERLTFSKHAGMTLQQLGELFDTDLNAVPVEAEAALILIAAQREDPSITFDQVLDNDGWTLDPPAEEEVDGDPLPPPLASES